jgi:tRNA threonylcarbamoyladenosine biosynthesis protein TsaE
MVEAELANPAATRELGHFLGERLFPGAVVALVGQLGAGKTNLCRAIAEGLGVPDSSVVTSPTFVLIQEYEGGRLPLYHFDAYRLRGEAEFAELGSAEYFEGAGVCLVEWADRVAGCLPREHLRVELSVTGPTGRLAAFSASGKAYDALLQECKAFLPGRSDQPPP